MSRIEQHDSEIELDLDIRPGERVSLVLESESQQIPSLFEKVKTGAGKLILVGRSLDEDRTAILLFVLALLIYAMMMGIRLESFPAATDAEALNAGLAESLLQPEQTGRLGQFSPACFMVEVTCAPTAPVFLQLIPQILFGRVLWAGRGIVLMVGMCVVIFFSFLLRRSLTNRLWWSVPLWLALSPAWFVLGRASSNAILLSLCWCGMITHSLSFLAGRPRALFWLVLWAGLSLYAEPSAALGSGAWLLWTGVEFYSLVRRSRGSLPRPGWHAFLGFLLISLFLFLPWLASLLTGALGEQTQAPGSPLGNYIYALSPVLWLSSGIQAPLWNSLPAYPAFSWLALPFALWGMFLALYHWRDIPSRALLVAVFFIPLTTATSPHPGLENALPLLLPLLALTVNGLSACLGRIRAGKISWPGVFIVLSGLALWMLFTIPA